MRKIGLILLAGALLFSAGCSKKPQSGPKEQDKLLVSVSFHAMKEFVKALGKDKVEIVTIVPDGTEAHGFEPKARDLEALSSAAVFVYNGLGMEPWANEAIQAAGNKGLLVVDASAGADLIEIGEEEHQGEEHEDEDSHGSYDPHLWLGLSTAKTQVYNIKEALIKADPSNGEFYRKNYDEFVGQLDELFTEYKQKFDGLSKRTVVTGHAVLGYLCRDFSLQQDSIRDIYAGGEPSAQQLARLVDYCKEQQVTTIFSEQTAGIALAETLAHEVGVQVKAIYTIETEENGSSYLERMKENLEKIYLSLQEG